MKFKKFSLFIVLVFLVLLVIGCGSQEPAPAAVVSTPVISEPKVGAPSPQQPGQEIGISVDVSSGSGVALNYTWNADGGEIVRGQGSPAITYRVPDEPGTYNVRVKVEWNGQSVEKVTSVKVEAEPTSVPTPEPPTDTPEPPTDTPTPKPTSTPKPTNTPKPPTDTPTPAPTNTPNPPTNTPTPTHTFTPQSTSTPVLQESSSTTSALSSLEAKLIGKWELQDKDWKETLEFWKDGKYQVIADYGEGIGQWWLVDDSHLVLAEDSEERTNVFRFQEGQLILVDRVGEIYYYNRIY